MDFPDGCAHLTDAHARVRKRKWMCMSVRKMCVSERESEKSVWKAGGYCMYLHVCACAGEPTLFP